MCEASGSPTPNITWSKVFNSLPSGRYKVSQEIVNTRQQRFGLGFTQNIISSNLTLTNVSTMDNGIYICKATNKLKAEETMGQLTVLRARTTNQPDSDKGSKSIYSLSSC
jgi:hypothetical protein